MREFPAKTPIVGEAIYPAGGLVLEPVRAELLREAHQRTADWIRLLWNRRSVLLRAAAWGFVVAGAMAFLLPRQYTSTARLMPPDPAAGSGASALAAISSRFGSGLTSVAGNALGFRATGALFIGILQSDTVRNDVIRAFHLESVYGARYPEDARRELSKHTEVAEDQESGIISIAVTDRDARRAAAMVQEYVNRLNWVVTHLNTSAAHRERIFLDQRLQEVKVNLERAEKQFSRFASQQGAIDVPAQGKALVTAAAKLQGELIAAEAELQAYQQLYTDHNVRVRSLKARVRKLRSSLENLAGKGADETTAAEEIYPSLRQLPLLGVTYADLLRRQKVQEAVFETLTKANELAKVEEAKEIPSVKVLDPPEAPRKKSFPPRLLMISTGTLLALLGGAAWVLLCATWEATALTDARKLAACEVWSALCSDWRQGVRRFPLGVRPARWLKGKLEVSGCRRAKRAEPPEAGRGGT